MMDDSDLRNLFQQARAADEASASDFQRLRRRLTGGEATSRRLRWGLIALPAAAVLALGLGLLVAARRGADTPSREADPSEVSALTLDEWTAPTDFLLETPGRDLLGSFPPIGAGIPEVSVTEPSTKPKGT